MNALKENPEFGEIVQLIEAARQKSYQAVNTQLIDLYWQVGAYISGKLEAAEWGDSIVAQLANYLALTQPNLKGFTRPNLFRMRQFYETYRNDTIVSPLVRQLPWTHNLIILSQTKRPEEREFYLKMAAQECWSKRELERQINGALFERVVLSPAKTSPVLEKTHPEALNLFKDSYMLEFLDLPTTRNEADLHQGLLNKLKEFLLELGGDFCFVGSEFPLQVGKQDFYLDLLFYHRNLNCLVAIELKATLAVAFGFLCAKYQNGSLSSLDSVGNPTQQLQMLCTLVVRNRLRKGNVWKAYGRNPHRT